MNPIPPASRKRTPPLLLAVLALCATVALALLMPTTASLYERTNSVVWVFVAVGLYFLLRQAADGSNRRERLFFACFGFLGSLVYAFGRYVYLYHEVRSPITAALLALLLTPAAAAMLALLARLFDRAAHAPLAQLSAKRGILEGRYAFLFAFGVIVLCCVPCYLAFFPANINFDIANQAKQAVTGEFCTNHPLLHTLFIKICFDIGNAVWGNYTAGFALYAAIQTLLLAGCFAYAVCAITRLTPGRTAFHWIVLALFALYPSNHIFAITTTKDVLASGALLVSLSTLSLLLFDGDVSAKPPAKRLVLFVLSSTLAMLLRNSVVYTYLPLALCVLLFVKRDKLRLLLAALVSIGLCFGCSAALKGTLHASPGSSIELYSVPIQQLVYASIVRPECFSAEEQALFDALIETNGRYLPQIVDPIKEFIDREYLAAHLDEYRDLYASIGKKAPDAYANAFLVLNLATWYPDEITHSDVHGDAQGYLHTSDWFYKWDKAPVTVEKHSYLPAVESLYERFTNGNLHQSIPVVSMLFSPGFLCGALFTLTLLLIYRRQCYALIVFVPLIAYWVGLLFAPCIYIRYVYPIIVCLPLTAALTLRAYGAPSAGGTPNA